MEMTLKHFNTQVSNINQTQIEYFYLLPLTGISQVPLVSSALLVATASLQNILLISCCPCMYLCFASHYGCHTQIQTEVLTQL